MHAAEASHRHCDEITILRVKRKRGQEPLEALLVHQQQQQQSQRRKLTPTVSTNKLFELGQTLTQTEFDDQIKRQALQNRLSQLAQQQPADISEDAPMESVQPTSATRQLRFRVSSKKSQVQYEEQEEEPNRLGIPQVVAAADIARKAKNVRILDAIRDEDQLDIDDLVPLVRSNLAMQHDDPEFFYDFYFERKAPPSAIAAYAYAAGGMVFWTEDADDGDAYDVESECEDEEDDSNAEDYYANDYPDDPDTDSDGAAYYYSSDERERMQSEARAYDYDNGGGDDDDYDHW
ncbi:hypothetical protein J3B02_002559 [Coemansia erecta]|uniref:Probable RNA polymerase II nuclear localization protein SLC7A6OS n=1 Tax=Coemansia asiatica TaxID=1052880 RepID=A0A9W7XQ89_9FUNG|nr:hypothetical protein LPJ64_001252 [Coemansia asiatica]KAJ2854670.1 hypothetical protein J3B02_002559 [Coemansia erecta]